MNVRIAIVRQLNDVIFHKKALHFTKEIESHQNGGFIKEVCFGTLRYYYQLDELASMLVERGFKTKDQELKLLLMSALYQLLYTDKPDHAVLSETVNCCNIMKKVWAKAVINGSLRRFLREKEALFSRLTESGKTAHPKWLIKHIQKDWPNEADIFLNKIIKKDPYF